VTLNNFSPALIHIICAIWWGLTASQWLHRDLELWLNYCRAFKPVFTCSLFERSCTRLPDHSWEAL